MQYIKPLDTLRAIAVVMVIFSHWNAPNPWNDVIGSMGVDIFFVLSGFLITRILLHQRIKIQLNETTTLLVVKHFYIRRALRIFPIYYLVVFAIAFFQYQTLGHLKPDIYFYISYTANYCFSDMSAGHLWSLSAEEQFYLIWPWIILFTPQSRLLKTILLIVLTGVLSKYLLHGIENNSYFTVCCLDAFGAGGLLAWITSYRTELQKKIFRMSFYAAIFATGLIVFGVLYTNLNFVPFRVKSTCIAFFLVSLFCQKEYTTKTYFTTFFQNPILLYIGKISYGLYLFHLFIPILQPYLSLPTMADERIWIVNGLLLLSIASVSYYLIEKPFLRLKKRYE